MQGQNERRAAGVRRVVVERIVDVCATTAAPSSAFQGRSVDVSGRGMAVRATHLPELNAPIVVRFQEDGSEVIAEGVVAWRREKESGSEFGVRFTALDSRSVQALKALCQGASLPVLIPRSEPEDGDTEPVVDPGGAVRLHIGGFVAPLSARVRQQGERRLSLGSSLEFLRVGRSVEVEEGAAGKRRGARIDEVDVAIDPDSQVPELIVSLCYESGTPLPRPASSRPPIVTASRVQSADLFEVEEREAPALPASPARVARADAKPADGKQAEVKPEGKLAGVPLRAAKPRVTPVDTSTSTGEEPEDEDEEPVAAHADSDDDLELGEAESSERPPPIIRRPSEGARTLVSRSDGQRQSTPALETDEPEPPSLEIEESDAPSDFDRLRHRLDGVLEGLSSAARVAGERCRQYGASASRGMSQMATRARDAGQNLIAARRAAAPTRRTAAAPRPSLRSAIARAGMRSPGARGDGTSTPGLPRGTWLAAGFIALAAVGAWRGRPAPSAPPAAPQVVAPATAAQPAPTPPEPGPSPSPSPRPLLPPVDGDPEESIEPESALALSPLSSVNAADRAPEVAGRPARVPIEKRALARFAPAASTFEPAPAPRRKASAPVEFSSGRLELPIVHRLRLDKEGEGLRGERTPTGFDVVIVGRKVLEPPTSIARRDARIAKITTRTTSEGTRLSFRFRSTIPAYKVRLRNNYVEIFISSK